MVPEGDTNTSGDPASRVTGRHQLHDVIARAERTALVAGAGHSAELPPEDGSQRRAATDYRPARVIWRSPVGWLPEPVAESGCQGVSGVVTGSTTCGVWRARRVGTGACSRSRSPPPQGARSQLWSQLPNRDDRALESARLSSGLIRPRPGASGGGRRRGIAAGQDRAELAGTGEGTSRKRVRVQALRGFKSHRHRPDLQRCLVPVPHRDQASLCWSQFWSQ